MPQSFSDDVPQYNSRYTSHNVGFEAAEHSYIGNLLNLQFPTGTISGADFDFGVGQKDIVLSLGDIVALGGDFIANWKSFGDAEQISDQWLTDQSASVKRFTANAAMLAGDSDGYVARVLKLMAEERALIEAAVTHGQDPAQEFAKIANKFNEKYAIATRVGLSSAYLMIALCNWDHFGQDAIYAYRAGHTAALAQARKAQESGLDKDLRYAYFLEGFALHFLTDLFSSGHLRPPRRILHRTWTDRDDSSEGDDDGDTLGYPNPWPADGCAKEFHDEDCANGLWVTNHLGESWAMYGDGQLFDDKSTKNLAQCVKAAQIGVDEVWNVYLQPGTSNDSLFAALNVVPDLTKLNNSYSPLFHFDSGTGILEVRQNLEQRASRDYIQVPRTFLSFRSTLNKLEKSGIHINQRPYSKGLPPSSNIIQLQRLDGDKFMVNTYGPLTSMNYRLTPPTETTSLSIVSRSTVAFQPDEFSWKSSTKLTQNRVLALAFNSSSQDSRYAAYKIDFGKEALSPIQSLWDMQAETRVQLADMVVAGRLSGGSQVPGFVSAPLEEKNPLFVLSNGIDQRPSIGSSFLGDASEMVIRNPLTVDISGQDIQVLATVKVSGTIAQWKLYMWTNDYKAESVVQTSEQSTKMIDQNWWRYLTGSLLKDSNTTQFIRLFYGQHTQPGNLRIEVVSFKGSPLQATQEWAGDLDTAKWGNPEETRYVKWLLMDVTGDGNLDLVSLINTDESTLTVLVFASNGDFSFSAPTVSRIVANGTLFNPAFFKSILVAPASIDSPGSGSQAKTGILQLFDNYQVLGARLLGPVSNGSQKYELKGQLPAIAGQISLGAGDGSDVQGMDDWPGFFTQPVA